MLRKVFFMSILLIGSSSGSMGTAFVFSIGSFSDLSARSRSSSVLPAGIVTAPSRYAWVIKAGGAEGVHPPSGSLPVALWEATQHEHVPILQHPLIVQLGMGKLPEASLLAYTSALARFTEACSTTLGELADGEALVASVDRLTASLQQLQTDISPAVSANKHDIVEGSSGAVNAAVGFLERSCMTAPGPIHGGEITRWNTLIAVSAFLRLCSTIGHTLQTAIGQVEEDDDHDNLHLRAIRVLSSPELDKCLQQVEAAVDSEADRIRAQYAEPSEEVYRRQVALLLHAIDVIGYESGLKGSSELLTEARKVVKEAMGPAKGRQAAALAAALAYKKAKEVSQSEESNDQATE